MKFRIINILLALHFFIAPCVVFGLTGKTPEEDDCANKYNIFRKYRDELNKMASDTIVRSTHCKTIKCAELGFLLGAVHYSLSPFSVFCNRITDLLMFKAPTNVRAEILQRFQDILKAYNTAEDMINALKNDATLSQAAKDALLDNVLPPNWDKIIRDIQREIDADNKLQCLEDEKKNAENELAKMDDQWKTAMENYDDAVKAIKYGDTACDADFSHTPPSKPDYSCSQGRNPQQAECFTCGLNYGGIGGPF